jgi:hypothetical protein
MFEPFNPILANYFLLVYRYTVPATYFHTVLAKIVVDVAPLNFGIDSNDEYVCLPEQWTGKLLKNKPPVAFGFIYEWCPFITLLDSTYEDIWINCDNRH